MDDDGVDIAVTALATAIRAQFAPQLAALQCAAQATSSSPAGAFDDALAHHARTASKSAVDTTSAWMRMLLTVFRRYARELVVRGKLLNQEELLVSQFARLNASGTIDASVRIPSALGLRFIVRCVDGPVERVGCDDVVARIETDRSASSSASSSYADVVAAIVTTDSDDVASKRLVSPTQWDQPQALTALKTLYGFDVRSISAPHAARSSSACVARMADAHADCANAVLMRSRVFRDLRATHLLQQQQQRHGAASSPPLLQSFIMTDRCSVTATHPQSYVALGQAQKRAWATERFRLGQHLVAQARVKDAVAEFTSCLQLDDTYAAALYARSDAYCALQQFRDAVRDLETLQTLDAAFPGLDAALARAQSKLRHAQRVDVVASAVSSHRGPVAAPKVEQSLPRESRPQKPVDQTTRPRSRSPTKQTLERDRLRSLLEAEVSTARRKQSSGRDASDGESSDSSNSCSSSDADASRRRHRKRKAKAKAKKHKKHKTKKHKATTKRRRHGTRSASRESERDRSRHTHRRSTSRHRSRRSRSASAADAASSRRHARRRSRSRSASPRRAPQEQSHVDAPHPILARERHRIWN